MTAVEQGGKRTRLRRAERLRRPPPARPGRRASRGSTPAFAQPNYAPGQLGALHIATDEPSLEAEASSSPARRRSSRTPTTNSQASTPASRRSRSRLTKWRSKPHTISFRIPNVPSGLYYASVRRRPTAASATRRSSFGRPSSARRAACSSSCRRTRGRPTTSRTSTGTATATRGTRARRTARSTCRARTSRAACRRASTATTCRSCTGSTGRARSAEFISDSDFDLIANGDELANGLRPRRVRGARGVRDDARVRRRRSASATSAGI